MFWVVNIIFAAFLLILLPAIAKLFRQKEIQRAKAATASCVLYSLLFVAILLFRQNVPYWALLLTMAATFISCFWGQCLGMYFRSKVFDRYLHAYGAFAYALLFFYLLRNFLDLSENRLSLAVFVFLLGNTLGVIFELLEFSRDMKPTTTIKNQHGLKDTDTDMLFNLFGSIGAAVFVYFSI